MIDLDKCKAALPMPQLMERIGIAAHAKRKAKCPWHEDGSPSFSVFQTADGKWFFKCHAGCGSGDEVEMLAKFYNIASGDAIRRYAELAGVSEEAEPMTPGKFLRAALTEFPNATVVQGEAKGTQQETPDSTPTRDRVRVPSLQPLSPEGIRKLAQWRGLPVAFVKELAAKGVIGTHQRMIAFPVTDGLHYRIKKDGSWRYTEGAKPNLFELGEVEEGAHVHVFESQWDALAYGSLAGIDNIVATRGASNIRLLNKFLNYSGTLYLWPQNDEPGRKWARDIASYLNCQIKLAVIPAEHKDMNDWLKAGALPGHCFNAYIDAKTFPVTKDVERSGVLAGDTQEAGTNFPVPMLAESGDGKSPSEGSIGDKPDIARESTKLEQPTARSNHSPQVSDSRDGENDLPISSDSGDRLISLSKTEGDSIPRSGVAPAPGTAPLAETLDKVLAFLNRYVKFPREGQAEAVALWIAHTYIYKAFRHTPYLHIYAPEKNCGKSVLLDVLALLVNNPLGPLTNISKPAFFRTVHSQKPVVLWDEVDNAFKSDDAELIAMLNDGYKAGGVVIRCDDRDFNKILKFEVYCPKAFTGIGKIPDTTHSRCIDIRLVRQMEGNAAEPLIVEDAEQEAEQIKQALSAWADKALDQLKPVRPEYPRQIKDGRKREIIKPLLAIADSVGGDWPNRARTALVLIFARTKDGSLGTQLLASIREAFGFANKDKMSTIELLGRLVAQESADAHWAAMWERDLSHNNTRGPAQKIAELLAEFEIKPQTIRDRDDRYKGYVKADFEDAWERYLEPVKGMENMELGI